MAILDLQALEPPVLEGHHHKKRRSRWSKHCGGHGGGSGLSLLLC